MKKFILFMVVFVVSIACFAQRDEPEKAKPMVDTEIVRRVSILDVEGKYYFDVTVALESKKPDYFLTDKYKVKVKVTNASGKKVWNKTFKNVFLYVFSDGQIQVGQQNFDKLVISKSASSGKWTGIVREKEGVYFK